MKKIRKNYSGVVPNGKVLNSRNNSLQDTYSSDYLNRTIDGLTKLKVSPSEPTTGEEVWLQKGKNLIKDTLYNHINGETGLIEPDTNWFHSQLINVKSNEPYTFSLSNTSFQQWLISYYQEDGTFISGEYGNFEAGDNSITKIMPTNCSKVYVGWRADLNHSNVMFEQGETATDYEPYIDKKIYTKNDNGVYEEFSNEESKEVILFKGSTQGDVVLSDNVSNYKYIDIIGELGGGVSISTKALTTSSKISLIGVEFDTAYSANVGFVISGKELLNEGNTLKVIHAGRMFKYEKDAIINDNEDSVLIKQVIGYK